MHQKSLETSSWVSSSYLQSIRLTTDFTSSCILTWDAKRKRSCLPHKTEVPLAWIKPHKRSANTSRWNQGWIYPLAHQLSRQVSHCECINTKFYINWVNNAMTGNSSLLTFHYFPMLSQDKLQVLLPSSGSYSCVGFFPFSFPFSLHSLPIMSFSCMKKSYWL